VKALADRHSAAAGRAAQYVRAHLCASAETSPPPVAAPVVPRPSAAARASAAPRTRRQSRYEDAARLRAAGVSINRIAAELGTERKTVRRWLKLGMRRCGSSRQATASSTRLLASQRADGTKDVVT
jgi:DNA-binding NarL/FixJ family response regulator